MPNRRTRKRPRTSSRMSTVSPSTTFNTVAVVATGSACATELAMTEHAGTPAAVHRRGDESGQGSHAWIMPSGTDIYHGDSGRQARTSKDCHSQAPTSSPRDLGPTTVAAPEARPTSEACSNGRITPSWRCWVPSWLGELRVRRLLSDLDPAGCWLGP